ncbi:hypothetical protein Bcep1808_5526 [Burkholderia vietnamiensis G4]|uniref:Uncharacterized protein n=1 Tax=Burkholderia vietnamiensis (strain G4 / LMG 22486) TaxID=269482 RepID=A4JQB7_BURVG|nr:hypothetical protein Bcep1808_5526 [Burkholderia vietnamiensis G4]
MGVSSGARRENVCLIWNLTPTEVVKRLDRVKHAATHSVAGATYSLIRDYACLPQQVCRPGPSSNRRERADQAATRCGWASNLKLGLVQGGASHSADRIVSGSRAQHQRTSQRGRCKVRRSNWSLCRLEYARAETVELASDICLVLRRMYKRGDQARTLDERHGQRAAFDRQLC